MNRSALFVVGIALALLAGALTWVLQSRVQTDGRERRGPQQLVTASRDLPPGAILADSDLALVEAAPDMDAKGSFRMMAPAIGRVTVAPLRKGQMVAESDLAPRGSGATILAQLPPGFRAITVLMRDTSAAVALFPGASVDLIATMDGTVPGSTRSEAMSRTVVERSRVLAVNSDTGAASVAGEKDGRAASRRLSVTLAVTPEQAAQIELASVRGAIGLALCATSDPGEPSSNAVSTSSLLGLPEQALAKAADHPREKSGATPSVPPSAAAESAQAAAGRPPEAGSAKGSAVPVAGVSGKTDAKPVAPRATIWEVTVIRGSKSETLEFEQAADETTP